MRSLPLTITMLLAAGPAWAAPSDNLVRNPRFELAVKQPGLPDEWQTSGDAKKVSQRLTLDQGRAGRPCGRCRPP